MTVHLLPAAEQTFLAGVRDAGGDLELLRVAQMKDEYLAALPNQLVGVPDSAWQQVTAAVAELTPPLTPEHEVQWVTIPPGRRADPRVGLLCTRYGGLDVAVELVLGGHLTWYAETDRHACTVLAHHWPTVPNLGDIRVVDWARVEPVDVLTAGDPPAPPPAR